MKSLLAVSIIFFIGITGSFTPLQMPNDLSELRWLLGEWQMQKKNGTLVETWRQKNDSTFEESSYLLKSNGETKLLEEVTIVAREGKLFYIPVVADQNNNKPVSFEITFSSSQEFTAENAEHDFPKRIYYKLISADSLYAKIDGGPQMPEKKSEFYYSRNTR